MADTTIMMLTYNRLFMTKQCFELMLNTAGEKFNLVIVDNGSDKDETQTWLKERNFNCPNIDGFAHVQLPENRGVAAGRSIALKAADLFFKSSKFLSTIDNDIGAREGWLTDCKDVVQYVPKIGMCGVNVEGVVHPQQEVNLNGRKLTIQIKPQGNLGTVCTVFKRQLHDMIGFFNTEYKNYGQEDADFGVRLILLGYKMAFLNEPGIDLSPPSIDKGDYRDYKNIWFKKNLDLFYKNIASYRNKTKPLYIPFKEDIAEFIAYVG